MKEKGLRLGAFSCAAALLLATGAQALSVEEAREILQRSYVDRLPRAAQDASSLDELFSYTDDYTYYMTGEEYKAFLAGVEGEESLPASARRSYTAKTALRSCRRSKAAARRRRACSRAT